MSLYPPYFPPRTRMKRSVAPPPLLFTVEFRRMMAELPVGERRSWLRSLAATARAAPSLLVTEQLREVARGCRLELAKSIPEHLGTFDPLHLRALVEVPRERFVREDEIEQSADDIPLPLDDEGLATISAPHAYLLSYRLLELRPRDRLVELGSGSGYGAALASFIVGPHGRVRTFEIDRRLSDLSSRNVATLPNVVAFSGDAMTSVPRWEDASKVVVTFAVETMPQAWVKALPDGGCLVAPVGAAGSQRLEMVRREGDRVVRTEHGAVRYVPNRSR